MKFLSNKIIIAILFFIVFIGGLILLSKKQQNSQNTTTAPVAAPKIPNYLGSLPVQSEIENKNFDFPSTLSILTFYDYKGLSVDRVKEIAKNLGFINSPNIYSDSENGDVYYYSNDQGTLTITPKVSKIDYSSNKRIGTSVVNRNIDDNNLKAQFEDLLTSKLHLDKKSIKFDKIIYLSTSKGLENYKIVDKENAEITQLNYSLSITKYPITTIDPNSSIFNIQFLRDGTVFRYSIYLLGNVTKSDSEYKIKSESDINSNLDKATVVSINNNNVNIVDLDPSKIKSIKANNISLFYYIQDVLSGQMQPMFLIEGEADIQGYSSPLSTVLYLPAFSK